MIEPRLPDGTESPELEAARAAVHDALVDAVPAGPEGGSDQGHRELVNGFNAAQFSPGVEFALTAAYVAGKKAAKSR